jgi:hypothetical protein
VHVVVELDAMVAGAQLSEPTVKVAVGIWSVMVAVWLLLPSFAVMTAEGVVELVSVPVVAENVVALCPECRAALAGTVTAALLLPSRIVV